MEDLSGPTITKLERVTRERHDRRSCINVPVVRDGLLGMERRRPQYKRWFDSSATILGIIPTTVEKLGLVLEMPETRSFRERLQGTKGRNSSECC